jgi:hypothetical protein
MQQLQDLVDMVLDLPVSSVAAQCYAQMKGRLAAGSQLQCNHGMVLLGFTLSFCSSTWALYSRNCSSFGHTCHVVVLWRLDELHCTAWQVCVYQGLDYGLEFSQLRVCVWPACLQLGHPVLEYGLVFFAVW